METSGQREMRNRSGEMSHAWRPASRSWSPTTGPAVMLVPVAMTRLEQLIAAGEVTMPSVPLDVHTLPPPVESSIPSEQVIDELRGDR